MNIPSNVSFDSNSACSLFSNMAERSNNHFDNNSPLRKYHFTPPNRKSVHKVRNPFERALFDKLDKFMSSPGMCKIYEQANSSFKWDIDQACILQPADIVVCNTQSEPSPDPAFDKIAEEASDRFFSQMILPSPLDESTRKATISMHTSSTNDAQDLNKEASKRDVAVQTVLTLPPELPPEVEAVLQSYYTYTKDQNDPDTSNVSLRRKLLFTERGDATSDEDEQEAEDKLTKFVNCQYHTPPVFSPDLHRNMISTEMRRNFGTPLNKTTEKKIASVFRSDLFDDIDGCHPCFSPIRSLKNEAAGSHGVPSPLSEDLFSPILKGSSGEKISPKTKQVVSRLEGLSRSSEDLMMMSTSNCHATPEKVRSGDSLKTTPGACVSLHRSTGSLLGRCWSGSNLSRTRSVQRLDFGMDMSVDGSTNGSLHSLRCRSRLCGSDLDSSPVPDDEYWRVEMVQTSFSMRSESAPLTGP